MWRFVTQRRVWRRIEWNKFALNHYYKTNSIDKNNVLLEWGSTNFNVLLLKFQSEFPNTLYWFSTIDVKLSELCVSFAMFHLLDKKFELLVKGEVDNRSTCALIIIAPQLVGVLQTRNETIGWCAWKTSSNLTIGVIPIWFCIWSKSSLNCSCTPNDRFAVRNMKVLAFSCTIIASNDCSFLLARHHPPKVFAIKLR